LKRIEKTQYRSQEQATCPAARSALLADSLKFIKEAPAKSVISAGAKNNVPAECTLL
jgi:hypothetical protein